MSQQSREERARAALKGRTRRNVPLVQPNASVPVSYVDTALPQETLAALPQHPPADVAQSPATTTASQRTTSSSIQNVATTQQDDDTAALQQDAAAPIHPRALERELQGTDARPQQHDTFPLPQATEATAQKNLPVTQQQDSNVLSPQQESATLQQIGNSFSQSYKDTTVPHSYPPTVGQNSSATQEQYAPALPFQNATSTDERRNDAISRYRDTGATEQGDMVSPLQRLGATLPQDDVREERHDDKPPVHSSSAEILLQSGTISARQDGGTVSQKNSLAPAPQRPPVSVPQSNDAIEQENSETAALESMLASVPEEAVAQLMQALLATPKVNKLNSNVWRSGGMQVTHGTHKSYKLLAGQYGVHIRDLVEQSLKACLPIWRARLRQLRIEGVLDAEPTEEEVDE